MNPDGHLKYLDCLQSAIGRMAANSFTIKGWTIAITTTLIGIAAKEKAPSLLAVGALPVMLFWGLDAYFLVLERRFRQLFHIAAKALNEEHAASFEMSPGKISPIAVLGAMMNPVLLPVHGLLAATLVAMRFV